LGRRISELDIPLWARNRAALYLANDDRLSAAVRYQLAQVVYGYIGSCDEDAARKGMEWMRERDRDPGRTPTFSRRRSWQPKFQITFAAGFKGSRFTASTRGKVEAELQICFPLNAVVDAPQRCGYLR
jgi:hypothetical protein